MAAVWKAIRYDDISPTLHGAVGNRFVDGIGKEAVGTIVVVCNDEIAFGKLWWYNGFLHLFHLPPWIAGRSGGGGYCHHDDGHEDESELFHGTKINISA